MNKPLAAEFIRALKSGRPVEDAADVLRAQLDKICEEKRAAINEQLEIARWVAIGLKSPVGTLPRKIARAYLQDFEERERAEEAKK